MTETTRGLEIGMLGPPMVRRRGQEIVLGFRKAAALLYHLAAQPGRPLGRAHLAGLLWEEHSETEGRNSLSTALSRLRQALSTLPTFPIVTRGDTVAWQPDPDTHTDLARFTELTTGDALNAHRLEAAIALYRGAFLEGFEVRDSEGYEQWLAQERERWQRQVLATFADLIAHERARERFDAAIGYAQRAVVIDPLQEPLHQILMRLYFQSGNRASALAQFQTCERVLRAELNVGPSAETRALRDAMAAGRMPHPSIRAVSPTAVPLPPARPAEPAGRAPYPLVGREAELRRLRAILDLRPGQASRLVAIQGEAGIGKTRLTEEILGWLSDATAEPAPTRPGQNRARWTILLGHSYPDAQGLPYHPIIEALRGQLATLPIETLPVADIWLAEVNRLLPEIGSLRSHLPAPARLDPPQERRRLFEGIVQLLCAFGRPRLLVLEDLHWADTETLHLLAYLTRHPGLQDTLFLVTLRPEDTTESLAQILTSLEYERRLDRLRLGPLSATGTAALLREIAAEQSVGFAEQIHREAEGNALFAIELARSLVESHGWPPRSRREPSDAMALPPTIQAVIRGRLARLDPTSREFLNSAAIFRRDFDFEEVRAIAGQSEDLALEALETLLRVQVLREITTPVAAGMAATRYRFSHEQIRRVAYESLSDARRRMLHRRVVEQLSGVVTGWGDERAEELAHHAGRAQAWSAALTWSERAAAGALELCAYDAAMHHYEQALACASQLPMMPELRGRIIDLRLRLARAAFYVRPGSLMDWLAPAEAEASQAGDPDRLAQVWLAQAGALYIQGQFAEALPRLERLLTIAEHKNDPGLRARTENTLGRLLVIRGELGRGLAALERALAAADSSGAEPVWTATPLERLVSTGLAACAQAFRGDFRAAEETVGRFSRLTISPTDAAARAAAAFYRALIVQTRGDWDATVTYAEEAITNARAAASLIYEYVSHVYLGLALARQGRLAEGLAAEQAALALADQAQTHVILGRAHAWLADILLQAGQSQEADAVARRGQALSREHGFLLEVAMCARVRGEIYLAAGRHAEAMTVLSQARIDLARLEAWPEWARAEAALGLLRQARGETELAREHAQRAAARFAAMGMAWDLARVGDDEG